MPITKEVIEARVKALNESIELQEANIERLKANLNATRGAAQDCGYWLVVLNEPDP